MNLTGTRVFEYSYGWGTVSSQTEDEVHVDFDCGATDVYTTEGRRDPRGPVVLSLQEYNITAA